MREKGRENGLDQRETSAAKAVRANPPVRAVGHSAQSAYTCGLISETFTKRRKKTSEINRLADQNTISRSHESN